MNGRPPIPGEFAFLAEVRAHTGPDLFDSCGGSFVSPTQVITAAHCVERDPDVQVGVADGTAEPTAWVRATKVEVHERYSPSRGTHDIALITLTRPLDGVPTVRVPTPEEWPAVSAAGSSVQSAGWGSTSSGGSSVDDFLVADLTVIPDETCEDSSGTYVVGSLTFVGIGSEFDPDSMICAGGVTPRGLPVDTCQGDSGGPLTTQRGPEAVLIGIVSWGLGCAGMEEDEPIPLTPGVYTRLGSHLGWLASRGVGSKATPPGPVRGFSQSPFRGESPNLRVTVRWKPPRDDGGWPITRYRARLGNGERWRPWTSVESPRMTLTRLRDGKRYVLQIRAVTAIGPGPRATYGLPWSLLP